VSNCDVLVIQETKTEVVEIVTDPIEVIEIDTGLQGPPGVAGPGVPAGGSTGEVLTKASPDDFDAEWRFLSSGGGGGGYVPQDPHASPPLVAANLPVGSSAAFDAPDITPGKVGRVLGVHVGSAAPCRVDVELVDGARTIIDSYYFGTGEDGWWYPPSSPAFWDLVGNGSAHFGCTATNLGGKEASDVHVVVYWDEVT